MSVAWASGTIIAPLLGGLLCKPAVKYPFFFSQSSLFAKYPYALPSVIIGCFQIITAILCVFVMKETRFNRDHPLATTSTDPSIKQQQPPRVSLLALARSLAVEGRISRNSDYEGISTQSHHGGDMEGVLSMENLSTGDDEGDLDLTLERQKTRPDIDDSEDNNDDDEDDDDDADTDICLCVCCCPYSAPPDPTPPKEVIDDGLCGLESGKHTEDNSSINNDSTATTHSAFTIEGDDEDDDDDDHEYKEQGMGRPSSPSLSILTTETDGTAHKSSNSSSSLSLTVSRPHSHRPSFQTKKQNGQHSKPRADRILYRKGVVLTCALYGLLAMTFIIWDETIPLHLKLDTIQKGYGYSSNSIGLLLSASGAVMLLFTSVILPILTNIGKLRLFNIGVGCAMPIAFSYPVLAYTLFDFPAYRIHTERVFFFLAFITVLKNMTGEYICTTYLLN